MEFGIGIASASDSWKVAQRAEELGFTHAWFYDTQMITADVFVAMAAAAVKPSRIRLGAGVLVPSNRIAAVTANAFATLNGLAPGRIDFGVGTGFSARRAMGLGAMKLADMEEYIRVVSALLAGETVETPIEGNRRKIRFLNPEIGLFNTKDPIPLHISAYGPKSQALTAKLNASWKCFIQDVSGGIAAIEGMQRAWRDAGHAAGDLYATAWMCGCVLQPGEPADSPRAMAQAGPRAATLLHRAADVDQQGWDNTMKVAKEGIAEAVGVPEADAGKAAESTAASDISGADGHGAFRLPQYIRSIKAGGLNTRPEITVIRKAKATALVDGDNGLGSLVVVRAVEEAIALARGNGVGWVGTRNGNHAGAAAVYAAMPLVHDMIGLYFAVGNANHLPPWGAIDMLLSTNPIAIAVPALEEPPLVLDMATTVAAYGKVKVAAQQGKTMPVGWMIDREGGPLTDPNRADDGFLLPIGGYKGAAMSLMFGLLAGTLNGAANGEDVVDFNKDDTTPTNTGQAICAIDIKAFAEPAQFKRQVDAFVRQLHGSALLPGFDHTRLPGHDRHRRIEERRAGGIPIPPELRAAR